MNNITRSESIETLRDTIKILCTREIEKNYIEFYFQKKDIKRIKIEAEVVSPGVNNLQKVIEQANKLKIGNKYYEVIIIIENYNVNEFNEAVEEAEKLGINYFHSNTSIEYWFLIHLVDVFIKKNKLELINDLNRQLKEFGLEYIEEDSGSFESIFNKIYDNTEQAERYAEEALRKHRKRSAKPSDWCSSTTLFVLTQYLKKIVKMTKNL